MLSNKTNERISYFLHTIRKLIHEGFRYWNYTSLTIGAACVFITVCIEAEQDFNGLEGSTLNYTLNILMPILTVFILLRYLLRFYFSISRSKCELATNIIRYIFYHVLTLLLLSLMAVETVTNFVFNLIPVGITITIFVYAMVLLLTGKNKVE